MSSGTSHAPLSELSELRREGSSGGGPEQRQAPSRGGESFLTQKDQFVRKT